MNEGYALFDKVVSVLENANNIKTASNNVAAPQGVSQSFAVTSISPDESGVYLIISKLESTIDEADYVLQNALGSNVGALFSFSTVNATMISGGGCVNIAIAALTPQDHVQLSSYNLATYRAWTARGRIALIKLLGGGYCVTLLRALERRWSHERGLQSLRQDHRSFGKLEHKVSWEISDKRWSENLLGHSREYFLWRYVYRSIHIFFWKSDCISFIYFAVGYANNFLRRSEREQSYRLRARHHYASPINTRRLINQLFSDRILAPVRGCAA